MSTFESEFSIAAKRVVEMIETLRYELRRPAVWTADDGRLSRWTHKHMSFMKTKQLWRARLAKPKSTLNEKHNDIAYNYVWEARAAGIVRLAREDGETKLADELTKCLSSRIASMRLLWEGVQKGWPHQMSGVHQVRGTANPPVLEQ